MWESWTAKWYRMFGLEIVSDACLPVSKKWVFPEDKFVEWRGEDESYCRFAGYGHEEVDLSEMKAYRIGRTVIMHPLMLEAIKRNTRKSSILNQA